MTQDNAVHIKNVNGALTLFDVHGDSLGAADTLKSVTKHITDAQIRALYASPVTLVAAPGSGLWINVVQFGWVANIVTAYDTPMDGYIDVCYQGDDSAHNLDQIPQKSSDLGNGAGWDSQGEVVVVGTPADLVIRPSRCEDKAILLRKNAAGEWTGGAASNSLSVFVLYTLVPIPVFGA